MGHTSLAGLDQNLLFLFRPSYNYLTKRFCPKRIRQARWSPSVSLPLHTTSSHPGSSRLPPDSPSNVYPSPLWDKTRSLWDIKNLHSHERGSERSERASERVSAAEGASEASSPEQANEWAVRVNERTDERVALYLRLYSYLFQTTVHL